MDTSENNEALIVLTGTLVAAATSFIAALPFPNEVKVPVITLVGAVSAAILIYWKTKVNTP
jgi:hypothetical protein